MVLRCLLLLAASSSFLPAARAATDYVDPLDLVLEDENGHRGIGIAAMQPDGKIILSGLFSSVWGVPRRNLARLRADGTLDPSFDPRPNGGVTTLAVQPDGKILLGGDFTAFQPNGTGAPVPRKYIARVNADGTLDADFDPEPNALLRCLALQADGKVVLGGYFTTLQPHGAGPVPRNYIARVFPDGTLDGGFDPAPDLFVECLAVQRDGKVVFGGRFITLHPNGDPQFTGRGSVARTNADGTLDRGFNPNVSGGLLCLAEQPDGKVLLGGTFSTLQPNGAPSSIPRHNLARVNADGTLDTSFSPNPDNDIYTLAQQADGNMLVGGYFRYLYPHFGDETFERRYLARLHPDGTPDPAFRVTPNNDTLGVTVQPDGRLLLVGHFIGFLPDDGTSPYREGFARVLNDPATQSLTVPDATRVLWQRGGTAPELSRVTFDLRTHDGASWVPLGPGTRIGTTADWQLTGLALPSSGQLRASGVSPCGIFNNSSGIIAQTIVFPPSADTDHDGLPDAWELTWWPSISGHSALDDFDHDGYNELLEFALGLNPAVPDPGGLPQVLSEGGYLTMTLTKHPGVTYEVQSAGTLLPALPDSFSTAGTTILLNDATTLKVRDNSPLGTRSVSFLRLKVTAVP